ncbi:hypothetical protein CBR_g10943 [Chara braunii]|uniref:Probable quinone oxidoreductase n=1 Tax=Chara braunii TaxID=69332 RepID=A0A388KPQ0_CHABU|nr:hypothetical protein CBR_g10943 [Chara braunii]|eukprot:GBG72007.1 hypothetical protein CBR_g10943 [Chara braunii]
MVKAIRVHRAGGPEVLQWETVEVPPPEAGEIRLKHTAIGVNFFDTYMRWGVYAPAGYPFTPGMEGAGVVTAIGEGVTSCHVGQRVAYAGRPVGSYAEERIMPANRVVPVPDGISDEMAAAIMLKGMTAHMLLIDVYPVKAGQFILVHAAAGGMGILLSQWARSLGAIVIGTVSSEAKAKVAMENGVSHPIIYTSEDLVQRVKEITQGKGVSVVYDGVGKDTFMGSLDCLAPRGMLVSYGQASGSPPPFHVSELGKRGSLSLSRPALFDYIVMREDLVSRAEAVFSMVLSGALKVSVPHRYPLAEASRAHEDLEARKTTGSVVLLP